MNTKLKRRDLPVCYFGEYQPGYYKITHDEVIVVRSGIQLSSPMIGVLSQDWLVKIEETEELGERIRGRLEQCEDDPSLVGGWFTIYRSTDDYVWCEQVEGEEMEEEMGDVSFYLVF